MRVFAPLYDRVMRWAVHPKAPIYLGFLSFIEAFVFPVPPEIMLAPMALAHRERAFRFAAISLFWSTLGGCVGYIAGYCAFHWIEPWLRQTGYGDTFDHVRQLAVEQGFWLLLVGGFMPVPFKFFTLAAGVIGMPVLPFLAGVIVGRGKRVFLVSAAIYLGGQRAEKALRQWVEYIGWGLLAILVMVVLALRYRY
jgi:membrane protein YqaA with SNARE-associated domain